MDIITRKRYAEKVDSWLGKSHIIVIVGQRRVGKSYVLKDFIQRHGSDPDTNIVYIDKEKRKFGFLTNGDQLGNYIEEHIDSARHNYILVDEIQDIDQWEKPIRSFRTSQDTQHPLPEQPDYIPGRHRWQD